MYEGEISRLLLFIFTGLPRLVYELSRANRSTTTTTIVNSVTLPNYNNVWSGMFGNYPAHMYSNSNVSYELSGPLSVTDSAIDRALDGEDGIDPEVFCDPINWWNYPGAPPEMLAMVHLQAKMKRDEVILEWDEGCRDGMEDVADMENQDVCMLDVPDVGFGETACPEP